MTAPVYPVHPPVRCGILSIRHELTFHLVMYTLLICVQIVLHHNELRGSFICYVILAWSSLVLGCIARRFNENLLLVPLLLVAIFDMFRYLVCAVSMTVGTRSYFFEYCKIWFLLNHEEPEDYAWAGTYGLIFLYIYWMVATLNKIITKGNFLQPSGQQLPLLLPPRTPEVSRNMDSPPKYTKLSTPLETPPPRYAQLRLI